MRVRTQPWAERSLQEMQSVYGRCTQTGHTRQCLACCRGRTMKICAAKRLQWMAEHDFDGYGIGGAIEKQKLGEIVQWCNESSARRPAKAHAGH
jgi:queuine tRNA-ribosyltransferase